MICLFATFLRLRFFEHRRDDEKIGRSINKTKRKPWMKQTFQPIHRVSNFSGLDCSHTRRCFGLFFVSFCAYWIRCAENQQNPQCFVNASGLFAGDQQTTKTIHKKS